ncbi:hypothetical protein SNK03_005048 [Fusarium graminearum]|uniref:Chromosome 2, complete genome n=2 Tax=Gibberella zeae TaxID=5518 RepID=I1S8X6_GIBZE|nr:hypothetical protein FGSG_13305 [Fusarium graminearum PH-1]CAF3499304.1 unnamed protein product [Fusarium graminearum]ESU14569.1 hypothetical protein FGSG_13305 [Fusarium graminearum PH-1]CAF3661953.1 unnamed protein product [Fusarium graminearum]CAG1960764.1 unnamed protein product [Fusarium graminearum]CAG1974481.1 unnamed protein product [Fusarium graminearum]|eukprot:XP_011319994.1 hypothetical protein FGSG_13305 [Fusarium graminearum PH-1]
MDCHTYTNKIFAEVASCLDHETWKTQPFWVSVLVPMPVPAVAGSKRQSRPGTKGSPAHLMLVPVISIPFAIQATLAQYIEAIAPLTFSTCRTTPQSGLKAGTRGLSDNITKACLLLAPLRWRKRAHGCG